MKWSVLFSLHYLLWYHEKRLASLLYSANSSHDQTMGIFSILERSTKTTGLSAVQGQPEKWILFDLKMLILYVWNTIGCSVSTNLGKLESFRFTWSRCIFWEGFPYEEPLKWGELDKVAKNCSDQYHSFHNLSSMFGILYNLVCLIVARYELSDWVSGSLSFRSYLAK